MTMKLEDNEYAIEQGDIPHLLSLAAEHDRVDILQDLLQRAKTNENDYDVHNRILNFPSPSQNKPFVPPLHIAISSGSVHASTCLLRLGADPSIRPQIIPKSHRVLKNKSHPSHDEKKHKEIDHLDKNENEKHDEEGSVYDEDVIDDEEKKISHEDMENDEEFSSLRKYHNLSAYELMHHSNLSKVKKQGIEHAFFAEALRAIGSEDVKRLECLLKSGMKAGNEDDMSNEDRGVREKTLLDWAIDMAEDCPNNKSIILLKNWGKLGYHDANREDNEHEPGDIIKNDVDIVNNINEDNIKVESAKSVEINNLRRKIEESDSLAASLQPILEDIMQETSICQTLLLGPSPGSNGVSPLVTHVKTMKALRAQKEVELEQYQDLWDRAYHEEQRLKQMFDREYRKLGGEEKDEYDVSIRRKEEESANKKNECKDENIKNFLDDNEASLISSLTSKLEESEARVRTFRASLVDLSEENSRVRTEIQSRGLSGAIRLARTLREELIEFELKVKEAKEQAELCQLEVKEWNYKLQRLQYEDIIIEQSNENLTHEDEEEGSIYDEVEEEDEDSDDYTTSSGEYEEYTDEEEDSYEEDDDYDSEDDERSPLPSSRVISSGKSKAIVIRQQSRFTLELWDLICRIVGLGKSAVKETTKSTLAIGRRSTRVMTV